MHDNWKKAQKYGSVLSRYFQYGKGTRSIAFYLEGLLRNRHCVVRTFPPLGPHNFSGCKETGAMQFRLPSKTQ